MIPPEPGGRGLGAKGLVGFAPLQRQTAFDWTARAYRCPTADL